jgi:pimeloyl-ACP methyl ester carboxylesterase
MRLFFQKIGQGPVVTILHGLYGSSDNWITVARKLADNYTVYLADQRNHGRSPHHEEHSYSLMAEDVNELMLSEGVKKSIFIGHSMGGKTAMQFAALYPEKVSALIIVDIGAGGYAETDNYSPQVISHLNIMNAMLSIDFQKMTSRTEIDNALTETIADISTRQFIMKNVQRHHDNSFGWKLNIEALFRALPAIMGPVNLTRGKAFNFPVLFIKGERSNYISPAQLSLIKEYFPESAVETIPGAGHWVHADRPEEFLNVLKIFLESIQPQ